jgi:HK97 family phage prohead protease
MSSERAVFEIHELEVRALADGTPVVSGYAVVFNQWSVPMTDGRGRKFKERVAPSAFDRALANNTDIRALWNHNMDYPLGRTANGTLQLRKDAQGLRFELRPDPDTFWGASAVAAIRRGDVSGMSFTFLVAEKQGDTWAKPESDGLAQRTLLDTDLLEVSPVTFPAYPQTSAQVRAVVPDFVTDGQVADAIDQQQVDGQAAASLRGHELEILRRR